MTLRRTPTYATRHALLFATALAMLAVTSGRAAAFPKRVIVIRGNDCPSSLHRNVARALREGSAQAAPEYLAEAVPDRAVSSDPSQLRPILSRQPASVAVVLHTQRVAGGRRVTIDVVDGTSVQVVQREQWTLRNPRLTREQQSTLVQATVAALGPAAPPSEAADASATDTQPAADASTWQAPADDGGLPPALNETPDGPPTLELRVGGGVGFGMRAIRLPTPIGERALSPSLFPAATVAVAAAWNVEAWAHIHFAIAYQTSFAWSVRQPAPNSTPRTTSARSHRLELLAGPELDFTDSPTSASLHLQAGYALRDFRAVDEVELPSGTLSGPLLRVVLHVPLGEAWRLSAGPEAQWVAAVDDAWQALGASGSGFGLGGKAALRWQALEAWAFSASYRESHALVGAADGNLHDAQRFGMLHLSWTPDAT